MEILHMITKLGRWKFTIPSADLATVTRVITSKALAIIANQDQSGTILFLDILQPAVPVAGAMCLKSRMATTPVQTHAALMLQEAKTVVLGQCKQD
tara:strand:- start:807 stop:1094 length:288 start_codon:yes stop_codon:yes gene_type:complete